MTTALVLGAGGFIGHHLVRRLKDEGYHVTGVDVKHPEFEDSPADAFRVCDLRYEPVVAGLFLKPCDEVYLLAANMGGVGHICAPIRAELFDDNMRISLNCAKWAAEVGCGTFFYSSSACAYNVDLQSSLSDMKLREEDAWPARPEPGYGLEKLVAEEVMGYLREEKRLNTRIARFHNCYGPLGAYKGGREKLPAAVCRKIAAAQDGDTVEVWGDGQARRSFMYVDDCVEAVRRLVRSDYQLPINVGTEEVVTVQDVYETAIAISGKDVTLRYDTSRPQGVRSRNSDNTLLRKVIGWEPRTALCDGLLRTYHWVMQQPR